MGETKARLGVVALLGHDPVEPGQRTPATCDRGAPERMPETASALCRLDNVEAEERVRLVISDERD